MDSKRLTPLHIDTASFNQQASPSNLSPTNSKGPAIPSLRVSTSPLSPTLDKLPTSPLRNRGSQKTSTRKNESQKLLAHVLDQLHHRAVPPSAFDELALSGEVNSEKGFGSLLGTVRGAVRLGGSARMDKQNSPQASLADEDDEDEHGVFSTDETFELMTRLRDLLIISASQGWQIFDDGMLHDSEVHRQSSGGRFSSPFRRSVNSLQPTGRRSRSPSPAHDNRSKAPSLLSQCISILSSVVSEDCRYRMTIPRPSRPPNALHVVTLEVAQFLLHAHSQNTEVVSRIVFALIPAFATFPTEMHMRLLAFFEECVSRRVLEELRFLQGAQEIPSSKPPRGIMTLEGENDGPPLVSIRVDEAHDSTPTDTKWTPWSSIAAQLLTLKSTNAPLQPDSVYHLASYVPLLLAGILENINFDFNRVEVLHRLYRLLDTIITLKLDAHLDVLEVMAYHTPRARRGAACLLTTFWPRAIGHVVISKSPVLHKFLDIQAGTKVPPPETSYHAHQFVPWYFISGHVRSVLDKPDCHACAKPIHGFGIFCPYCISAVHLECYDYPEGSVLINYSMPSDESVKRIAIFRFSPVLDRRTIPGVESHKKHLHAFQLVNIFTLCLCIGCREPLWGCHTQGVQCTTCLHFAHSTCISSASFPTCGSTRNDSKHIAIEWTALRQSYVNSHKDLVVLEQEGIQGSTYEDIAILYSSLSTQLQLLTNGIAMGTLVIMENGKSAANSKENRIPEFELHRLLLRCERFLSADTPLISHALAEFLQENRLEKWNHMMMFEWSNLVYIASTIKAPCDVMPTQTSMSDMLSVSQTPMEVAEEADESQNSPFEVLHLSHLRNVLGQEFNVHSDLSAKLILSHLHHLGLFDRVDLEPILFSASEKPDIYCVFPLPLGLDLSTDVETLFASVEACLVDLDISVNETGFLLLSRRLWPSGLASGYALARLARSIISWLLSEDDDLAAILRDYLASQQPLPGIRTASDPIPWPPMRNARPMPSSSVNNGGDYVASRRALQNRYAVPWLHALHDQDTVAYSSLLYDICMKLTDDVIDVPDDITRTAPATHDVEKNAAVFHDKLLRLMTKLFQNSVTFTVTEDLFVQWLNSLSATGISNESIPSLSRLFNRDMDTSQRFSAIEPTMEISEGSEFDPWHLIKNAASSKDSLEQSLRWLCVLACSGIDIANSTYQYFSNMLQEYQAGLSTCLLFVNSLLRSVWLRHLGRQYMQKFISNLHVRLSSELIDSLKQDDRSEALCFIRQSLAACLLLYGCDRQRLVASHLIEENEVKDLLSRKRTVGNSDAMDPVVVDAALMNVLDCYIASNVEDASCLVAKFLHAVLLETPFLEPYEIDNFVLRNGKVLSTCALQLYDIQRHEISALRTSFLLRVMIVDVQPFREQFEIWFHSKGDWQTRLAAIARLFRIILDATSPNFTVEGRQWRSSITDVFFYYFNSIWADEKEELRLAADTLASNLLPAHFEQISLCWSEYLAKSPIADRTRLITFLIQLRSHFPDWQVVSWDAILELLAEDQYEQEGGHADGPLSAHLSMYGLSSKDEENGGHAQTTDSDMTLLSVSVLTLSLDMIAGGVSIDYNKLLMVKRHVARVLGFEDVQVIPAANDHTFFVKFGEVKAILPDAYPCINQLSILFDAPHPISIKDAGLQGVVADDTSSPLLVGSPYVDILLGLFASVDDLTNLPVLTLKSLLEGLGIVIYKHNFENIYIRHLQPSLKRAVSRAIEIMLQDINYECRHVALSVVQAYIKRWHASVRSFVHFAIEQAAKLIISQSHTSQDPLVTQAKSFIENTLVTFSNNGIFVGLIRRPLDRDLFVVLKQVLDTHSKENPHENLRDALLLDTLPRAVDTDQSAFQVMLKNLHSYIEIVHHQNYSSEMMSFVGQNLTRLARRTSEWSPEVVDPAPLLLIPAVLIQHNKAQCRELFAYTDTVLRVALNRLLVDSISLSRLVQVTATLYRKTQTVNNQSSSNNVVLVIFEILAEGLRMKARVLSGTIKASLETLTTTAISGTTTPAMSELNLFLALVGPGFYFLHHHSWTDVRSDHDFMASLAVGKMILLASNYDPRIMTKVAEQGIERSGRQNMIVRAWNILALAALQDPSESWISTMFAQLGAFSTAHHAALRPYLNQPGVQVPEYAITDINHAYIAIKLWLLLAQKKAAKDGSGNLEVLKVWNELWPSFESLIHLFEGEVHAGLSPALAMLTWSTVADLFLFLRYLHSPVALHTSAQISLLERLRPLGKGEAHTGKLARTIRSMTDTPPDTSYELMTDQAAKDVVAAEKLRVLEANRDMARAAPERRGGRPGHHQATETKG